tara:strand:- start:2920 stop:3366 length:447 start_codon:yes stop_codon:yes gene_type:complete
LSQKIIQYLVGIGLLANHPLTDAKFPRREAAILTVCRVGDEPLKKLSSLERRIARERRITKVCEPRAYEKYTGLGRAGARHDSRPKKQFSALAFPHLNKLKKIKEKGKQKQQRCIKIYILNRMLAFSHCPSRKYVLPSSASRVRITCG